MSQGTCVRSHEGDQAPLLFISLMSTGDDVYERCEDCHEVK